MKKQKATCKYNSINAERDSVDHINLKFFFHIYLFT